MKIGFIGGGAMAEGIILGLLHKKSFLPEEIFVRELRPERSNYLKEKYQLRLADTIAALAESADLLVLAVRPQDAASAAKEIRNSIVTERNILVSICAGIQIPKLAGWIGDNIRIARIMPNTLGTTGHGYSALAFSENFSQEDRAAVQSITDSIGKTLLLKEPSFDAFTAVSCAGPEWLILFAAGLIDAGVKAGLSRTDSRNIVIENMLGSAMNLQSDPSRHPYYYADEMNTPGGISIEGFHIFQKNGLHGIIMDAVQAAYQRTKELGEQ